VEGFAQEAPLPAEIGRTVEVEDAFHQAGGQSPAFCQKIAAPGVLG
jgi:hypothetical protein